MDAESHIPDALAAVGQEIVASKHLSIACATVLFYEYLLTFSDEVRYAWGGKKTWVALLFYLNRYLPIVYKIWDLSSDGRYLASQLVTWNSEKIMSYCSVSTFTENSYLVLVTLFSQLFLAMRVYAVKGRSRTSFAILTTMTTVQFAYGVVYVAIYKRSAYTYVALVSPRTYTFAMCLQGLHETGLQLGYLGLSLGFDIIAFLMIATYSYKSARMYRASGLFGRVVHDATVYFLVIVWVHLTVTIYTATMGDARILRFFPAITNTIIPVLICRLVLSLRKATDPNVIRAWNIDHFSTQTITHSHFHHGLGGEPLSPLRFNPPTIASTEQGLESQSRLIVSVVNRSPTDSLGWTIDGPEDEERSRSERDSGVSVVQPM